MIRFKGKQEELVAYTAGQWAKTFQADVGSYCIVGEAAPATFPGSKSTIATRLFYDVKRFSPCHAI